MARKKISPEGATKTAKKGTVKKKKAGASAQTAAKSGTPEARKAGSPKATRKGAVKKKVGGVRLNEHQTELLRRIHAAGGAGYYPSKGELRTIEALRARNLVKRGAKAKATPQKTLRTVKIPSQTRGRVTFDQVRAAVRDLFTGFMGGAGSTKK